MKYGVYHVHRFILPATNHYSGALVNPIRHPGPKNKTKWPPPAINLYSDKRHSAPPGKSSPVTEIFDKKRYDLLLNPMKKCRFIPLKPGATHRKEILPGNYPA
jgi:hypothetical protein